MVYACSGLNSQMVKTSSHRDCLMAICTNCVAQKTKWKKSNAPEDIIEDTDEHIPD